jgi:integrase/recombinase XerD
VRPTVLAHRLRIDTSPLIYTQVSIRQLKQIHSATHPARFPKPKTDTPADTAAKAELLSALAAEDEDDQEPL